MIGSKLVNRYEILERVGGGGMAVVYKARCTLLNRIVAIKILRQQFSIDEDFVRRFRREAQAAASLSHPNIVSIYDVGQDKDTYFIVMEYVEGETLKDLIQREAPLEPSRAVNIIRQIANALYHAHKNKIIHRDIKPHNVLISKDGRVKVADFGIARAVSSTTQTFSPNSIMGSVHYFSPEQAKGKLATEQSDIYSLGIVFYELLTQHMPFDGESPISIALKHLQQTIPPADKFNVNVTPGIQGILNKMLEKDSAQRYQSISDLITDLRTWNVNTEPPEQQGETDEEHTQVYTPVVPQPQKKKPGQKNAGQRKWRPWMTISLIAVGLILMGIFGFRWLQQLWHVEEVTVPNLVGSSIDEAIALLEEVGLSEYEVVERLNHDTIPEDHVIRQSPSAQRTVKQNRVIELTLSAGPELTEVPGVEGMEYREAESELQKWGLKSVREDTYSEEVELGRVIRQDPLPGDKLPVNEEVVLIISSGPRPIEMPNLVGLTEQEARDRLEENYLEERISSWETPQGESPGGVVIRQLPVVGEEVQPGDFVDIWLRPYNQITKTIVVENLNPEALNAIQIQVKDVRGEPVIAVEDEVEGYDSATYEVMGWEKGTIIVIVNAEIVMEESF